ncbi:hypothetical protein [Azohydromonas caseinilytica]|uniref:Uncharacterized protein n=1 Tax=Azohydromonas caseinilytica TaxID=2728836 RepID=A0A848F5H9_9BURK|nr:hypothetical protein [Azohydromonas caseinilytica]NML13849.1 hypothetical protein [Azohydromonas caseinilytica]
MNPWIGWVLALGVLALGYVQYGWRGAVLGLTLVVFWLVLQFNRTVKVMRNANQFPVGYVESAVMLNAKLKPGMRMLDIVTLTRSLGQRLEGGDGAPGAECWRWRDAGGAGVEVQMRRGRCVRWTLTREADVA